ncbi:MAG: sensor domain-containing diguanylate cyclase, partial [Bacillota bacterium]|nr:sensor domain-containing diguanylate cyclase [Bacillota bacterium]
PEDVLHKSLQIIRESLGFDYADIWLLENEKTLRRVASNLPPVFGTPETFPADFCLPGLALSSGEGVYIEDPLNDERITDKTWVRQLGHASEAALPLIHQGQKLGVVIVASMRPYLFTPERCELLQTFVNQLALSIKNALLYREMEKKALVDELTGLFNHRYFQDALDKEIKRAEREDTPVSLIMLDLDYFKEYNDTFGHPKGDKLLREFGSVLQEAVRGSDIATRYGGDEFAIILPNTDEDGALQLSARVVKRIGQHAFPGYEQMPGGRMSVSVGYATFPSHTKNKVELVKLADDQMYKTKEVRRASRKATS